MMAGPSSSRQTGFLILADISGYTALLTQAELEHALEIVHPLLDVLIKSIHVPLRMAKLEGDALFISAPTKAFLRTQTLLETLENMYHLFAVGRESMKGRTRGCSCKGCLLTEELELKFLVHYGEFVSRQHDHGEELAGPDVILLHRLLKNRIVEIHDIHAYVFLTNAALEATGNDGLAKFMHPYAEHYDHLGTVEGFFYDVRMIWKERHRHRQIAVKVTDPWAVVQKSFRLPPSVTWECLNDPGHLTQYCAMDRVSIENKQNGRTGVGSRCLCTSKGKTLTQLILDWYPFEYYTLESESPLGRFQMTIHLEPTDDGTIVEWLIGKPLGNTRFSKIVLAAGSLLFRIFMSSEIRGEAARLDALIQKELAEGKLNA